MYLCMYCNKECKNINSLRNHERLCKFNPLYIKPKEKSIKWINSMKLRRGNGTNQYTKAKKLGLPKPTLSLETRNKLSAATFGRKASLEERNKLSEIMQEKVLLHPESYSSHNVCGRVKKIKYKETFLTGSWELLVAKLLDDANIKWTNKTIPVQYYWNNKYHLYFPDFYLSDLNLYIEVKGFQRERDICKWAVLKNLIVLKRKEIDQLKRGTSISVLISNYSF